MTILNFGHLHTSDQLAQIAALAGFSEPPVAHHIPTSFDDARPYDDQLDDLLQSVPLTPAQLQTEPLLVVLPRHPDIAGLLLAALHGICGYFPSVVRLARRPETTAVVWDAVEVIRLQDRRESARKLR